MDRELLTGFLRLGFFIGGCGFLMIFFQPPGSAEYVLSVCSAAIGGFLIAGVAILTRVMARRHS